MTPIISGNDVKTALSNVRPKFAPLSELANVQRKLAEIMNTNKRIGMLQAWDAFTSHYVSAMLVTVELGRLSTSEQKDFNEHDLSKTFYELVNQCRSVLTAWINLEGQAKEAGYEERIAFEHSDVRHDMARLLDAADTVIRTGLDRLSSSSLTD